MTTHPSQFLVRALMVGSVTIFVLGCNQKADPIPAPTPSVPENSMSPARPSTPVLPTSVGTEIDDTVVTASVKSALVADADIKSFDFKVETRKGVVMLSGFVDNQAQLDRANSLAKGVAGVIRVENSVTLKSGSTTVGTKVDDSIITAKVKAALIGDEAIKSNDIAVITRKGEVQLSGFVNSQDQIDRAVQISKAVEGVASVSNEMKIKK